MYCCVAADTLETKEFACFRNIKTRIKVYTLAFD